jgi:hypothetical protein
MWEYIARNTISPFALPIHLVICGGWIVFSIVLVAIVLAVWLFVSRKGGQIQWNR